jgi:hypothetical protein
LLIPKSVIQDCREQVQQADVSGNI